VDEGWAKRVNTVMVDAGLRDVESEVHARSWVGGSAGCRLVAGAVNQLRGKLYKLGLTPEDLHRVEELMHHPDMRICSNPLVSTVGYKR